MKFLIFISLLWLNKEGVNAQMGLLNLEQPANADNQIDYKVYINSSNVPRKIFQINRLNTFFIENKTAPEFPNNVRYTQNEKELEYIIMLPIFPTYITRNDVQVTVYERTINIKVKDSGIQANELFLPIFDKDTTSNMYRGRDYEADVDMFQRVANTSKANVSILEKNLNRGNSFEVRVKIPKEFIFVPKYFKHFNWMYVKNLPVINGSEHNQTYDFKVGAGFKRTAEFYNDSGGVVEVFRKDESEIAPIDVNAFDIKQYMQQTSQRAKTEMLFLKKKVKQNQETNDLEKKKSNGKTQNTTASEANSAEFGDILKAN